MLNDEFMLFLFILFWVHLFIICFYSNDEKK